MFRATIGRPTVLAVVMAVLASTSAAGLPPGVKSQCPITPGTMRCVEQAAHDVAQGLPHNHIVLCDEQGNMCCIQTSDGIYKCKRIKDISSLPQSTGSPQTTTGAAH